MIFKQVLFDDLRLIFLQDLAVFKTNLSKIENLKSSKVEVKFCKKLKKKDLEILQNKSKINSINPNTIYCCEKALYFQKVKDHKHSIK